MIDAAPTAFAVGGYAYETRGFPKDPTAFYLVIGSPEMPEQVYSSGYGVGTGKFTCGQNYCGYHSYFIDPTDKITKYNYGYI